MEKLPKELPNKESAFIEEEKLGYLFRGKNKGGYFLGLGFSEEAPKVLREALLRHAAEHGERGVVKVTATDHGIKYNLVGGLLSPDGRNPPTRTIWQIDRGDWRPRLVTAYPV